MTTQGLMKACKRKEVFQHGTAQDLSQDLVAAFKLKKMKHRPLLPRAHISLMFDL